MVKSTFGARVGAMLDAVPQMRRWKDPERVWEFQERFGVRKTGVSSKTARPDSFISVDDDAISSSRRHHCHHHHHSRAPSDGSGSGSGGRASSPDDDDGGGGGGGGGGGVRRRSKRLAAAAVNAAAAVAAAADRREEDPGDSLAGASVGGDSSVHVSSSGYSSGANGEGDGNGQAKNIVHYRCYD